MFCSKQAHTLINATHRRALCARLNTFSSSLDELPDITNSSSIHSRNLRILVTEIFKSVNRLNPDIMWDTFDIRPNTYSLRQGSCLVIPNAKSVRAVNSFDFRAALAWNHLPSSIKSVKSLSKFKEFLATVKIYCQCHHCK